MQTTVYFYTLRQGEVQRHTKNTFGKSFSSNVSEDKVWKKISDKGQKNRYKEDNFIR